MILRGRGGAKLLHEFWRFAVCEKVRNQLQSALSELVLAGKQQLESAFSTSSFLLNPAMHYGAAVFLPQPKPVQIRDAA